MDRGSSLEAKFDALMIKLNQQSPRELTMGEIAYMQAQGTMMVNPTFQVGDANFVNNRGYVFRPNNNLATHYHPRLRNHENLSYGNQANVQQAPQRFSSHNAPPEF